MSPTDEDGRPTTVRALLSDRTDATWRPTGLSADTEQTEPAERLTFDPPPPLAARRLPVQGIVDRRQALGPAMMDVKLITPSGKLVEVLRVPVGGNYGPSPADPARFSERVNPRTAVCGVLAPYAAAACLLGFVR
jgi:hypothetical protein